MKAALHPDLISASRHAAAHGCPVHVQAGWAGGLSRSSLSNYINGIEPVRLGDPRIERLAAALGVPRERCFAVADARELQATA